MKLLKCFLLLAGMALCLPAGGFCQSQDQEPSLADVARKSRVHAAPPKAVLEKDGDPAQPVTTEVAAPPTAAKAELNKTANATAPVMSNEERLAKLKEVAAQLQADIDRAQDRIDNQQATDETRATWRDFVQGLRQSLAENQKQQQDLAPPAPTAARAPLKSAAPASN